MKTSKPYPWTCGKCRQKAVHPTTEDYDYDFEHDGRVYPIHLDRVEVHRCRSCNNLMLTDDVYRTITAKFRQTSGLLTPEQIRGAREGLSLTQKQLAGYLDVAEATISRWETGAQIQQRAMDKLLRGFFDVPAFRASLGHCDRSGQASVFEETDQLEDEFEMILPMGQYAPTHRKTGNKKSPTRGELPIPDSTDQGIGANGHGRSSNGSLPKKRPLVDAR